MRTQSWPHSGAIRGSERSSSREAEGESRRRPATDVTRYEAATANRPGGNRTCNPRFGSALPVTPALQPLLMFKDLDRPATPRGRTHRNECKGTSADVSP